VYLKEGVDLPGQGTDLIPPGATLVLETPGGGGMGDPQARDPDAIQADIEGGLVTN
jgi:N-methylhydantoinase B